MALDSRDMVTRWWSRDKRLGVSHCTLRSMKLMGCVPHCHSEYAFIICLSGRNEFVCDGVNYGLDPGELIVHNPGQVHQSLYGVQQHSETVTLYIDPSLLAQLIEQAGWTPQTPAQTLMFLGKYSHKRVVDLAQELQYELHRNEMGRDIALHSLGMYVSVRLLREILRPTLVRNTAEKCARLHTSEFSEVLGYMEARRFSEFNVAELWSFVGTSKARFFPLFKNSTGQTPNAYFEQVLIKKAQMLLRDGGCQVKEAALELGFSNISYFCKVFREVVGISPNGYREIPQPFDSRSDPQVATNPVLPSAALSQPGEKKIQ